MRASAPKSILEMAGPSAGFQGKPGPHSHCRALQVDGANHSNTSAPTDLLWSHEHKAELGPRPVLGELIQGRRQRVAQVIVDMPFAGALLLAFGKAQECLETEHVWTPLSMPEESRPATVLTLHLGANGPHF